MQSHEVIREASKDIGAKRLAAVLRVSPALVYKWCEPVDPGNPSSSGTRNPLDRVAAIVEATECTEVVNWLCAQAGGFFTPNPDRTQGKLDTHLLLETQRLVTEFSRLLSTVTKSIADDHQIDAGEAEHIRRAWEKLKQAGETFATACESGMYRES